MEVRLEKQLAQEKIGLLGGGKLIMYDSKFYITLRNNYNKERSILDVTDGSIISIPNDTMVHLYNAKIVASAVQE